MQARIGAALRGSVARATAHPLTPFASASAVELLAERQPDGQALLQTAQRRLAADWREICYAEL